MTPLEFRFDLVGGLTEGLRVGDSLGYRTYYEACTVGPLGRNQSEFLAF